MKKLAAVLAAGLALPYLAFAQTSSQDLRWRSVGPLRAGWSLVAAGIPEEIDTFYFGAADGGVWKTDDAGVTWASIANHAPFSSVDGLAIARRADGGARIYVGTGQTQTRYDVMEGEGVFRSDDDGATWKSLGLEATLHIGRIWVDPRNADVVLVAALGHLFGPNSERGVYRSENGGETWTRVAFVDADTGAIDLAADPANPDLVYAAFWQTRRYPWQGYHQPQVGPGSGIHRSTDGGKTWAPAGRVGLPTAPLGKIGLAVAPNTRGQRVYAVIDGVGAASGLYRSDDGGNTWALTMANRSLTSNYFGRVFADPKDAETVYFMGQSFRRSTDGGKTFSYIKGSPGGDDYHFLWINPNHPERLVLASDQGTTVSVNGGKTWSPWYNQPTGQFYRLAVDDREPYRLYSGQQDSGTVSVASRSDYGQLTYRDWHSVGGDERDGDIPDPVDPNLVYGSGLGGRVSRWDARTGRVANVSPWPISSYGQNPSQATNPTTWITPIAISPRKPHALYQGTDVLWRSLDKGQTWEKASPDLTGQEGGLQGPACAGDQPVEKATRCGYGVIFVISPSPAADGLIWIGTDNGRIQVTRDDGKSWLNVTPQDLPDWSQVAAIDASPTDPATAYVAIDRHRLDDRDPWIYVTHDFGASWQRIDKGLPSGARVGVVRQDPTKAGLLYAGTRIGMFFSPDDGANWHSLQLNLPRTGINDLVVKGRDVAIATQGRGLWILDDVTPLRAFGAGAVQVQPLFAKPEPATRRAANENRDTPLPPEFPTLSNPPTGAIFDWFLTSKAQKVTLEILDAQGLLVRRFASDEQPKRAAARQYFHGRWLVPPTVPATKEGHNRFVWDLRLPQPKSTEYDFSIAAVPGRDTATTPQGSLVLPGTYTARLNVDGAVLEQKLVVVQDPRSPASPADLAAQLAFSREVVAALAQVVDAHEAVGKLDETLAAGEKGKGQEAQKAKKARARLAPLLAAGDLNLERLGGVFSGLESDLEGADGPPTAPQREVFRVHREQLDRALAIWQDVAASGGR